ncbi:MAG TPA: 5-(carboxyamino)imidazole ribonucleotide synthase [Candidatus Hydrogenedentes bacterium]|nr:5-(carboxyamino)imidazole ribonucleotide synthase [Candidatus Hydrogenedentota bacterium]
MIAPGNTIGILGGGQLGWMIGLEAQRMGYRTVVLDPARDCSASRIADQMITASFDDAGAARKLASLSDVVTFEFERIPYQVLEVLEKEFRVRPSSQVLQVIQDRSVQRSYLRDRGFPQPTFATIETEEDLESAGAAVGFPSILKSARGGYDGKNQARVNESGGLRAAWDSVGGGRAILERFVPFDKEISVILARNDDGVVKAFPVAENEHRDHILFLTVAPARVPEAIQRRAVEIASGIAEALDYCGVMAVEMFVEGGDVLINEIAPRVHNSGHYTFGACATSQFEQHLRAVCGAPLGDCSLAKPVAMLNLLGDVWHRGEPRWQAMFDDFPEARLFLYNKVANSPRRKMGHVLFQNAVSADAASDAALRAYRTLRGEQP